MQHNDPRIRVCGRALEQAQRSDVALFMQTSALLSNLSRSLNCLGDDVGAFHAMSLARMFDDKYRKMTGTRARKALPTFAQVFGRERKKLSKASASTKKRT